MIKNRLKESILKHISYTLTEDQKILLDMLSGFTLDENYREMMLIRGYAGTGKTSMISAFIRATDELGMRTILLAPTGRAAKVLTSYAGIQATTIHKKIYRQKSASDAFGNFVLDKNLHSKTFFIVDEASMISDTSVDNSIFGTGNLMDDLIQYVYNDRKCKLILLGDTAQLPPVGYTMSLSMNKSFLQKYNLEILEIELRLVVRQSQESGILTNATHVRGIIQEDEIRQPQFFWKDFKDVKCISGNELTSAIAESYTKFGKDETIIICRSNKIANRYNQGIRSTVLMCEDELSPGDYLMVVKNNYFWKEGQENADFIANGDIIRIKRVRKYEQRFGFRFADVDIILDDENEQELRVKLIMDTILAESPSLTTEQNKSLFFSVANDYSDEKSKKVMYSKAKNDPYFNALQVKFAYAVTCHKSQGGQWKSVFIDQSFFRKDMLTMDYLKWLYTAITRATECVFFVNFSEEFFH